MFSSLFLLLMLPWSHPCWNNSHKLGKKIEQLPHWIGLLDSVPWCFFRREYDWSKLQHSLHLTGWKKNMIFMKKWKKYLDNNATKPNNNICIAIIYLETRSLSVNLNLNYSIKINIDIFPFCQAKMCTKCWRCSKTFSTVVTKDGLTSSLLWV